MTPFARYWMHSHWVTMSGEKMSKSLGNILSVPAITEHTRPIALRYYLISVHYRSSIEYSREALDDASKAFERIESFLHRVADRVAGGAVAIGDSAGRFPAGDGRRPRGAAGAGRHPRAGAGRATRRWPPAITTRPPRSPSAVRAMVAVLGIDPWAAPWATGGEDRRLVDATGHLIKALLVERATGSRRTGLRQGRRHPGAAGGGRIRDRGHQGRAGLVGGRPPERCRGAGTEAGVASAVPQSDAGEGGGVMAGNSQRRGAMRKPGTKKGAVVGRAGSPGAAVKGRGPTPPAEIRKGHPAARRAAAAAKRDSKAAVRRAGPPGPGRRPSCRRPWSGGTRSSRRCGPECRRPRCMSPAGWPPTNG